KRDKSGTGERRLEWRNAILETTGTARVFRWPRNASVLLLSRDQETVPRAVASLLGYHNGIVRDAHSLPLAVLFHLGLIHHHDFHLLAITANFRHIHRVTQYGQR